MPRIIDLSVSIENNMPVHKNMPRPVYLQWGSHESSKANKHGVPEDPFTSAIEYMGMLNHVGTHVDADRPGCKQGPVVLLEHCFVVGHL